MVEVFKLHHRLAADTTVVHETQSLLLLLANDARYPWLILVPKINDVRELYELKGDDWQEFHRVSSILGAELMTLFQGDKLNVAALGNEVPQLHVHHVVRFKTDYAWPAPIWGKGEAITYTPNELATRLNLVQESLSFCQ